MIAFWKAIEDLLAALFTNGQLLDLGATPQEVAKGVTVHTSFGGADTRTPEELRQRAAFVAFCRSQKGKHYHLGVEVRPGEAALTDEWDCSELTEHASIQAGLDPKLPDGARYQFTECRPVSVSKAGDLHFLWKKDQPGVIGHVMVDTGEGTFVHAVGGRGVVEDEQGRWLTHERYAGCRRPRAWMWPPEERA